MRLCLALTALLIGLALAPSPARALECRLASLSGPQFSSLVQLSEHLALAEGSITVECDASAGPTPALSAGGKGNLPVQLRLSLSPGASGSYAARQAPGGPRYNLYLDAGHQRVWGDGSGGSEPLLETVEIPLDGAIQGLQRWVFPVFAAVQAHIEDVAAGLLTSDSVLLTLEYQ